MRRYFVSPNSWRDTRRGLGDLGLVLVRLQVEAERVGRVRHGGTQRLHAGRVFGDEIHVLGPFPADVEPPGALRVVRDRPAECRR